MADTQALVFFYGSYMNRAVLAEVDLVPGRWSKASLSGFGIRIAPRANLVRGADEMVFGVLASAKHEELDRLYAHAERVLGEQYLPEAVLVQTDEGAFLPALCYIAPNMVERPAELAYVERIVKPARELGFPVWYLARLESFRP